MFGQLPSSLAGSLFPTRLSRAPIASSLPITLRGWTVDRTRSPAAVHRSPRSGSLGTWHQPKQGRTVSGGCLLDGREIRSGLDLNFHEAHHDGALAWHYSC